MTMINWTEVIVALIGLMGAILTAVIVPLVRSKTTEKQRDNINTVITAAVWAAEQVLKRDDPTGEIRKQYVVDYLLGKGIKLDLVDLDVMIEAAVKELNLAQAEFAK